MSSTVTVNHNYRILSDPEEFPSGETFRQGLPDDADQVMTVMNRAFGGGLKFFWTHRAAAGEDLLNVAIGDVRSSDGYLSWRNVIVVELNGKVCGCLFGLNELEMEWASKDPNISDERNAMRAVKHRAHTLTGNSDDSHTWYISFIAVDPIYQRRGLGSKLLDYAVQEAKANGKKQMSLVALDDNTGAYDLYKNRFGFQEIERGPFVKGSWDVPGNNWIIMRKAV